MKCLTADVLSLLHLFQDEFYVAQGFEAWGRPSESSLNVPFNLHSWMGRGINYLQSLHVESFVFCVGFCIFKNLKHFLCGFYGVSSSVGFL